MERQNLLVQNVFVGLVTHRILQFQTVLAIVEQNSKRVVPYHL